MKPPRTILDPEKGETKEETAWPRKPLPDGKGDKKPAAAPPATKGGLGDPDQPH